MQYPAYINIFTVCAKKYTQTINCMLVISKESEMVRVLKRGGGGGHLVKIVQRSLEIFRNFASIKNVV